MGKIDIEKYAFLILKIHKRSVEGKFDWKAITLKNAFQCDPYYTFRIRIDVESEYPNVILDIFDFDGKLVDQIHDGMLAEKFEDPYVFMKEIYEMARKHVFGDEDILGDVIESLDDLGD